MAVVGHALAGLPGQPSAGTAGQAACGCFTEDWRRPGWGMEATMRSGIAAVRASLLALSCTTQVRHALLGALQQPAICCCLSQQLQHHLIVACTADTSSAASTCSKLQLPHLRAAAPDHEHDEQALAQAAMAQQLTQALLKGGAANGGLLQGHLWQVRPVGAGDGGQDCSGLPLQAGGPPIEAGTEAAQAGWDRGTCCLRTQACQSSTCAKCKGGVGRENLSANWG